MDYDEKRIEEADNMLSNFLDCIIKNKREVKGATTIRCFFHRMIEEYVEYRIEEHAAGRQ